MYRASKHFLETCSQYKGKIFIASGQSAIIMNLFLLLLYFFSYGRREHKHVLSDSTPPILHMVLDYWPLLE